MRAENYNHTIRMAKTLTYIERDVSWMYFNHRILQEAQKPSVPLLERLSFLGIYSNNLDEFFRVRIASLRRLMEYEKNLPRRQRDIIAGTIKTINKLNVDYSQEYSETIVEVYKQLSEHGITLIDETQIDDAQQAFLRQFFYDKLNGYTNPVWFSEIDSMGNLEDNRIYLLVRRTSLKSNKSDLALIKLPHHEHGRFVSVPSHDDNARVMYLDDVVRYCLPLIFIGFKAAKYEAWSFKFTKDAEMEMSDDAEYGVIQKIEQGVSSRRHGAPVRLLIDRQMPKELRKKLLSKLSLDRLDAMLESSRYQNHKDLMSFPDCGHSELRYPRWQPIMRQEFMDSESLLDQIREKDRFLHVPYHSFDGYVRLLREAALKPEVKSIKTTLYRLAKDSKVVKALICAARNGKKVTAVVELLARFDEESNIKWSKRMQAEGINVVYGVEGLKIHSKLLLIESKKGNIACIGTGNFHEGNARIYTDYLMMTARESIVKEVSRVFGFIDRPFAQQRFRELLVSPNAMKSKILRLIGNEIKNARQGREAWIKIKINHITEPDMVNKLYQAAAAGVRIDLLVRGNCSLVCNKDNQIHAVGIIDRYLEHSRILTFCNGGDTLYYIGSADWMPRNLLNRIEVMTPVYDPEMQADLMRTLDYGLADTTNGRIVDGFGLNQMQAPAAGETPFRSQEMLYKAYLDENEQAKQSASDEK